MPETLEDLTNVMFKTFARCEYALKAAGYHGNVGPATPNWQKFARTISEHFVDPSDQEFKEAIDYILRRPPKKQVVRDGRLAWSEAEPDHQNHAAADLWRFPSEKDRFPDAAGPHPNVSGLV